MNQLKAAMLLATLSAPLLAAGHSLAGSLGAVVALVVSTLLSAAAYRWSDRIVLKMHAAQPISEENAPGLHSMMRELARRGGLPVPRLYMVAEAAPNAFATGRNPANSAIVVTEGLLRLLGRGELAGVLAHELGHIQRRDTLIMTITATLAGGLSASVPTVLWVLFAPFAAALIQMTISRNREFLADESGARLAGDPLPLAQALAKIAAASLCLISRPAGFATAHLYIHSPHFASGVVTSWFQTHPPTAVRIERLETMALGTTSNLSEPLDGNDFKKEKSSETQPNNAHTFARSLCGRFLEYLARPRPSVSMNHLQC